jgi:hypothetical protein
MTRPPLRAITLWPEWAAAIVTLDKRVENRTWWHNLPPGTEIAIHAGKHTGGRPGPSAEREGIRLMHDQAVYAGHLRADLYRITGAFPTSAIVAVATLGAREARPIVRSTPTGWAVPGLEHWWLDEVRVLREPVPCGGKQGLWTVPEDLAAAIRIELDPTPTERT